ncbi:MAG: peptidoglycan bridge formation glycyltransferase FemA/FemB family protein [Candidatus Dojkabacteria bacterium]|nr:peptidoglycan bridge formation glycyltransferase FemA/FemB family protein [Candidatus Dojkabacteria bacterium]
MSKTLIKQIDDKQTWENFVQEKSPSVFLQSWNWGQFQKNLGRKVWYLGIYDNAQLVGVCLCHLIPTRLRTHIYASNGPLVEWSHSGHEVRELISFLKHLGKKQSAHFIRIDPLIEDTKENTSMLRSLGLRKAATNVQAENRWILDITPDEGTLLKNMRKNTRYAVRRSEKEGVIVHSSTDPLDFEKFWPLFLNTVSAQKFVPHSKSYYEKQITAFREDGNYHIYWATLGERVLASALIPFYGDSAYYLHAASSDEVRNAFPAHALIWQAIRDAKARGLRYFDFWGIAPTDNPSHPWAGFTFFKTGFGGFRQDVVRAHDAPLSPLYSLVQALEATRRIWGRSYFNLINRNR